MKKATNLIIGAIYMNGVTGNPCRLVHIVPCQGVRLERYDGEWNDLVKFEEVFYAGSDEVQDFLEDARTFNNVQSVDKYDGKIMHSWERQTDMNNDIYIREDEDYLCRD